MDNAYSLRIGPVTLQFSVPGPAWGAFLKTYYHNFFAPAAGTRAPRILIQPGKLPRRKSLLVRRDANRWCISRGDFISYSTTDFGETVLTIPRDRYFFNSWLRVFCTLYLIHNKGLLLHSAGIINDSAAYLFPGRSGRGKSTMTRLLGKHTALSDELVMVSQKGKRFIASSTPFWGELKSGPGTVFQAPVRGIFFLRHGSALSLTRLAEGESLKRVLPTVLFFAKEPDTLDLLLSLTVRLSLSVPAYDLAFTLRNTREEVLSAINTHLGTEARQ